MGQDGDWNQIESHVRLWYYKYIDYDDDEYDGYDNNTEYESG
jgi:hypothetical protein